MLSICIPVFNYDIRKLVLEIHRQVVSLNIAFELLVYDDGSPSTSIVTNNSEIEGLRNVRYKILENNIGRSAIRNLLADDSKYPYILFLDADIYPKNPNFIKQYLKHITADTTIIYGGINYQKNKPAADKILRWVYGKERESLSVAQREIHPHLRFLTLNFIILKDVFQIMKFDENIPNLRHEDTLFALNAKNNNISVMHIDNPVEHQGLETSTIFMEKSIEASKTLAQMVQSGLIEARSTKLSKVAHQIIRLKLTPAAIWFQNKFKVRMLKNLMSERPSMSVFDFYRLCEYLKRFISIR